MHPALCQDAPVNSRMTWNIFRFRDSKAKPSLISSAGDWNLESTSQAQLFLVRKSSPSDIVGEHDALVKLHPLKMNMEAKHGGLEDDFPFQLGDFEVPC